MAGVYNASAQTLDIYVNGVLDNGLLVGTVPASQLNSPVAVNIGRRSGGFYFGGVIDEVRIYNRALSQMEIQSDMITPIVDTNSYANTYGNADNNSYRDTNSYGYIHADTYADSHSYIYANPNGYSYGYIHTNSHADTDGHHQLRPRLPLLVW